MSAPPRSALPCALAAALAFACAPAYGVVLTVADAGDSTSSSVCTLRNAITAINYGNAVQFAACRATASGAFGDNDTVVFAPALAHSTITLTQGQIANYAPLTLAGSGQALVATSGARVLYTIAFLHLSDLTLSGGDAGPAPGGALYATQASVRLDNIVLSGNRAASGGALAVVAGSATLTGCTLQTNRADGGQGGAALFASNANVTIGNSLLGDNASSCAGTCGGGVTAVAGSAVTLSASTLARNTVDASGSAAAGAVFANEAHVTAVNSTFDGNAANGSDALGGAVFERHAAGNTSAGVALTNVTLSGNTAAATNAAATAVAGGLTLGVGASGRATLANTILAGNQATRAGGATATPDLALAAGSFTANASLLGSALQPSFGGNANVFADDPGLAPLGDYGGPTPTRLPRGDSPALDAGSDSLALDAAGHALATDQRGAARVAGAHVDIGADEWPGDPIFRDAFGG